MGYRNIEVDGNKYKYVIGKTHLKIRGLGLFAKENFAPSYQEMIFRKLHKKYIVTPKMVADIIKGKITGEDPVNPSDYLPTCGHGDEVVGFLPFEYEIKNKKVAVNYCKDCYRKNAQYI